LISFLPHKKLETLLYRMVLKYRQTNRDYCFVLSQSTRLTDGQTDGQTDKRTHVDSKIVRMRSQSHGKMGFSRRKSATKFLCVKTFSGKVVSHSLAYLTLPI